ncbi:MAG: phosphoribosylformylglycinamidine synthase subunit PurQ [Proteobacteria bacterium]|nr:phosphoribosylformylglycinamidine synthase subunit PurQ [Pseudomonadota bacterium]
MSRVTKLGQPRIGLIQFPGSNCDADCVDAFLRLFGIEVLPIWHDSHQLPALDGIILPGGFSYGDYLRGGALASCSVVMPAIKAFAAKGGPIIGICNGFQILTESRLLPGTLLKNSQHTFICQYVNLKVAAGSSAYHQRLSDRLYRVPIAHGEGRYFVPAHQLQELRDKGQILFQYANETGELTEDACPNGAIAHIAGIVSENGRILGMMPHPERASDPLLGSDDGRLILEAFLATVL